MLSVLEIEEQLSFKIWYDQDLRSQENLSVLLKL